MNRTEVSMTGISTADLCTADSSVQALQVDLKPLRPGEAVCGYALTASTPPGQNAAIHRAVHGAKEGELLIVDAAGDRAHGIFGDLLAACCLDRGIVGVVIFDCIRDSVEVARLGLPVFYTGTNPFPAGKSEPGRVGHELSIGGVHVRPGDLVAADDDGVVVVSADCAVDVLTRAGEVAQREKGLRARIAAGETTLEILNL